MPPVTKEHLEALKTAITERPPYCSGTCTIPADSFNLYYRKARDAYCIDMSKAQEDELQQLAQACEPATFGVNQADVLDESYRKAGKLDVSNFATNFNPEHAGLVDILRSELLEGHNASKPIRFELYKLNVYGDGSFFKAHKDTPRSENMFGSLVVVYPAAHEGGALTVRHKGKEWTFDSSKVVASRSESRLGYIAFYSDVEHEVSRVTSGYRVTLTYNLFFVGSEANTTIQRSISEPTAPLSHELIFMETFEQLLADATFLPYGGDLVFGLRYQYPVGTRERNLARIKDYLKGSDVVIMNVAKDFSLDTSLQVVYWDRWDGRASRIVANSFADPTSYDMESDVLDSIRHEFRGSGANEDDSVYWVTELTNYNKIEDAYLAYGNEASLSFLYGDVCLRVRVGPVGNRRTA